MSKAQNPINVIIVDDEQEACYNLQNMLDAYVSVPFNILGVANNTKQAEKLVTKYNPQAVFLDIEMPNENAFEFLTRITPFDFEVIFVTAYDEYAIKAFKLNAVDYILKPISIDELTAAANKLRERLKLKNILSQTQFSYPDLANEVYNKAKSQRITLRSGADIEIVEFKDICYAEAQGSYTKIVFFKEGKIRDIILSNSLVEYEELLPELSFFRIHKTYLINCSHLKKITKDENALVIMDGAIALPISRRRYSMLLEFLKSNDYSYE